MRIAGGLILAVVAAGTAQADRMVSVAADASIGLGANDEATEQLFPLAAAFTGLRVALEGDPTPPTLRECWMAPRPTKYLDTVRSRCSNTRVTLVPQAGIERAWGDPDGLTLVLAGARLEVNIHYVFPRNELARIGFSVRGGLARGGYERADDHGLRRAWDAALSISTGDTWTFGAEWALTAWQEHDEMQTSTTYFGRMGLMLGARY